MSEPPSGIILDRVEAGYGRERVLRGISGRFALGSATAVIGPNGAGKSTLLKAITGLLKLQGGTIAFHGCGLPGVAYLPQRTDVERSFPLSAVLWWPVWRWQSVQGRSALCWWCAA